MTKNKSDNDMIGFQDFLEGDEKKNTKKKSNRTDHENYEITSFLDKDKVRLTKQIEIFEEKSYMIKTFPQGEKMIELMQEKVLLRRQEILEKLSQENSSFFKNLEDIFSQHFNS